MKRTLVSVYAHVSGWVYLDDDGVLGRCCHDFGVDEDPALIARVAQFELGATTVVVHTGDGMGYTYTDESNWCAVLN